MTNATAGSSSKPKQRTRKGKEREISSVPTATSAQVEDAPPETQTRKRGNKQTQKRKKDSVIAHTVESAHPPRPRARPLNKDGTQTSLNPASQDDSPVQPTVPESAASSPMSSPHAIEAQDTTTGPNGAAPELPRKRQHTSSREELNSGNKKRKTLDQRRAKATTKKNSSSQGADIVEKGNASEAVCLSEWPN